MKPLNNIIMWRGITSHDWPPDLLLEDAKGKLKQVLIMGFDENGEEYFSSSAADGGDAMWLIELAKKKMLDAAG